MSNKRIQGSTSSWLVFLPFTDLQSFCGDHFLRVVEGFFWGVTDLPEPSGTCLQPFSHPFAPLGNPATSLALRNISAAAPKLAAAVRLVSNGEVLRCGFIEILIFVTAVMEVCREFCCSLIPLMFSDRPILHHFTIFYIIITHPNV